MGIHGLSKLLGDQAPQCVRQQKLKSFFSRKIAVDASMHIYQFLVVVGRQGENTLTNEAGEVTSHLQGMFYRTVRMLEEGIKPVYVFDGKPPELKTKQLALRTGRRADAAEGLAEAKEKQDTEAIEKYSKRSVKVTREHNEDCKRLLRLMGVPIVEAPSEAEAQCAIMAKAGLVYGVATEDMDCLTFGAPRVIRHLMSGGKENDIMQFERATAVEQLGLTDDQFIDLCILLGCDYCPSIKGIGPVTALKLIKQHGNLGAVLAALREKGTEIPEPELYPHEEAHAFFEAPEVTKPEDLPAFKWGLPDEEGLVQFLANEKNFSEERVRKGVERIVKNKEKANQGRLESFFGPVTVTHAAHKAKPAEKETKSKGGKLGGVKGGVTKGKGKDADKKDSKKKGKAK